MNSLPDEKRELLNKTDSVSFRAEAATEWADFCYRGGSLGDFFINNRMRRIAVYGYGRLGKLLIRALRDEGIIIDYVIDKKAEKLDCPVRAFSPEGVLPPCDVIVITVSGYNVLREAFRKKGIENVISLKELLMRR